MKRSSNEKPKRAGRPIVSDLELWHRVARTVDPLSKPVEDLKIDAEITIDEPVVSDHPAKLKPAGKHTHSGKKAPVRAARPAPDPAPLTGLDRRTSQRLSRGQAEIERRLDLHGLTVEAARHRLKLFLAECRQHGARTVLVITGKGASPFTGHTLHGTTHFHSPERAGRLRRLFPQWLEEPEFRYLVAGFQPAHPKHGGGGAFYVRLRREKSSRS